METRILSIDVDYAFSPDISRYDDFVQGSKLSCTEEWSSLAGKGFTKPRVNQKKLDDLLLVFAGALAGAQAVYFIENHHEIISYLTLTDLYSVVNFDHHHDIFYPGWHDKKVLDEGNWVNWLDEAGSLVSYTWYRNEDSEDLDPNINLSCRYEEIFYNSDPLPEFDYIFICSSPNWIHEDNIYVLNSFKEAKANGKIRL